MMPRRRLRRLSPRTRSARKFSGVRLDLYMAAKKWDMAAAVASHLVKVEPENASWWINLAYATRRRESIEEAEAILLRGAKPKFARSGIAPVQNAAKNAATSMTPKPCPRSQNEL